MGGGKGKSKGGTAEEGGKGGKGGKGYKGGKGGKGGQADAFQVQIGCTVPIHAASPLPKTIKVYKYRFHIES